MDAATPDANLPVFERFETLEKLGEGGMCAVYRVRGPQGEVAIKVLTDPSRTAAERFAAEARMLREIRHPNVLVVHELHDADAPPWIVMELLAGLDLEERRAAEGAADPELAAGWFADLASGLAAVHAHGVRHRDIKPANIMLGHDGIPRLIDFGIARQTSSAHVTRQGFVLGTASYLPPEIFLDDDSRAVQDSEAADIYALGQSLYEVLVGEPLHPRTEGGDAVILTRIMKDKVARSHLDPRQARATVPEGLAEVVRRATAQAPSARTPTAAQLEAELRAWIASRRAAEAAPLTTIKSADLPAPPKTLELATRPPSRPPAPTPAPRDRLDATSQGAAPVARVATGAAGAAGFAGVGAVALLSVVVALVGVGALWVWAPADPGEMGARVVAQQVHRLASCRGGAKGDLEVVLSRRGTEKVSARSAGGDLTDPARSCVVAALADGAWPPGPWTLTVPVQLR